MTCPICNEAITRAHAWAKYDSEPVHILCYPRDAAPDIVARRGGYQEVAS